MKWEDLRTADQILMDMVADGDDSVAMWVRIADRLEWSVPSTKARFEVLRRQLGWQAD